MPRKYKVPEAGKPTTIRVDETLHADLEILMRTGDCMADVVKIAVGILADTYRQAWESGATPEGKHPCIGGYSVLRGVVGPYAGGPVPPLPQHPGRHTLPANPAA